MGLVSMQIVDWCDEGGKKHLMLDVLPKMKLVDREIECVEGVAGRLLPR